MYNFDFDVLLLFVNFTFFIQKKMWNFDRSHFSKSNKDKTLQAFKMTVRTAEPFTQKRTKHLHVNLVKKIVLKIIGHPLKSIYQLKPHDKMFAFCLNKYLISRENPGADDVYSAWFFDLAGIFLINGLDSKHLMKKCSWYLLTLSEKDLQLKEGAIFKINLPFQISSFARIFSI